MRGESPSRPGKPISAQVPHNKGLCEGHLSHMKIIYTNLQETDGAMRRSAWQLRVELDGSGNGQALLTQGGQGGRASRGGSLLSSRAGSSDLRRHPTNPTQAPPEGKRGDRGVTASPSEEAPPASVDATSIAHLLVRRFVEAQMRSGYAIERRALIDIFV